jgi:hypothetical protein
VTAPVWHRAPGRVRALEHAANLVVLLHDRLDELDASLPVSAPALRHLVAQVAELARCVERLDAAGPEDDLDDWSFERSGLIARDLWHAAAEFDFTPAQAEEHVAGLLYGLAELARTLGDELGDGSLDEASTLPACIASLTEALRSLWADALCDTDRPGDVADAYLTPVCRRLLSLGGDGLGHAGGLDNADGYLTRRAVLALIAGRRGLLGFDLGEPLLGDELIAAVAVVLGHLTAMQLLVADGGARAPLIFAPLAQETPDAPVV